MLTPFLPNIYSTCHFSRLFFFFFIPALFFSSCCPVLIFLILLIFSHPCQLILLPFLFILIILLFPLAFQTFSSSSLSLRPRKRLFAPPPTIPFFSSKTYTSKSLFLLILYTYSSCFPSTHLLLSLPFRLPPSLSSDFVPFLLITSCRPDIHLSLSRPSLLIPIQFPLNLLRLPSP